MTDLSRGVRSRRSGRRPGWLLLTVLLVLAIAASSALVFTERVELLKLAVILSLWAAAVAAFVSVIYRRQSDVDRAKARDLKLVYDLQLDREISARREYELEVESQLRRELASELRAQAADEVAALRAELAALRNNLEILFDADLSHRTAIETERTTVRAYSDWQRDADIRDAGKARFVASTTQDADDGSENAIIDVPEEPPIPEEDTGPQHVQPIGGYGRSEPPLEPWPTERGGRHGRPTTDKWQPVPAEGQWLPTGAPGSNWVTPNGTPHQPEPEPADTQWAVPQEPRRGRHSTSAETTAAAGPATEGTSRLRGTEPPAAWPVSDGTAYVQGTDTKAAWPTGRTSRSRGTEPGAAWPATGGTSRSRGTEPGAALAATSEPGAATAAPAGHAYPTTGDTPGFEGVGAAQHGEGQGQSVAELLARLQAGAGPTGGGRRRRRDD
ncbi:MAG: hypothetical protein JO280_01565 [Mycobacteriaceae bacterium]|nr:hypothetical protein [Mycobacteriaceae bacterium]